MAKIKSYDTILTRLMIILNKLSKDERPNTKELALEFNVSIRTIQNDIYKRLSHLFPIEKDQFGRLKFFDHYYLCVTIQHPAKLGI